MTGAPSASAAIATRGLTKIFRRTNSRLIRWISGSGRAEITAVKDLTFDVGRREVFGLVGRNGAGKTTLIKIISSLIEPTKGSVRVLGRDPVHHGELVKRSVGLVTSDDRSFYGRLTGLRNLQFFARMYGMDEARARSRIGELSEVFELGEVMNRRFQEFSTGNKQRLAIVRALLLDPPLILLDEPTRSLDPIAADELRRLIRQRMNQSEEKTVLITTHNLAEIEELCDRVAILSRGQLKEIGTVPELEEKHSGQERVMLRVRCSSQPDGWSKGEVALPALAVRALEDHTYEVEFVRRFNDAALHRVFSHLVNHGAEILGCHATRLGLKEIMERIERETDPG